MQQSAVPFELTPRAFAIAIVFLFMIIHGIRFVSKCTLQPWRLLREISSLWYKNKKLDEEGCENLDIELGDDGFPVADVFPDKIVADDEKDDPKTCGTRAMLGPRMMNSKLLSIL